MLRIPSRLFSVFLLLSSYAVSAPLVSESLRRYVTHSFPDFAIIDKTEGDLDGDGVPETVLLLVNDKDDTRQLVLFRGTANGSAVPLALSKPFFNCQHGTEIAIHKKSLWISCFHSGTGTLNSVHSLQFAVRTNRLRLVGSESSEETGPRGEPDPAFPDTGISTNYLTGDVITTKKWQGRVISRTKSKLPVNERAPRYIEDVDL